MRFFRVSVNVPQVTGLFDYHLPDGIKEEIQAGSLVVVPFGQQTVQGIIWKEKSVPAVEETKGIQAVLESHPVVTAAQRQLAQWLQEEQRSQLPYCLSAMLPPGMSQLADTLYTLNTVPERSRLRNQTLQQLVKLLHEKGPLRKRQIERRLSRKNWEPAMQRLIQSGFVSSQPILPDPKVRAKTIRTVRLDTTPDDVREQWETLGSTSSTLTRRQKIMEFLIKEAWDVDTQWVFAHSPEANTTDLRKLADMGLIQLGEKEIWRDPLDDMQWELSTPPKLLPHQANVWQQIRASIQNGFEKNTAPFPTILQGVTGSGKTELYLRAVEQTLAAGKGVIVLIPEISLTPQTVRRFAGRFPGKIGLVHSRLSAGERYDTWRRVRLGKLPIIIGPRSALFSPMPDLGLIIVDEFDDQSYYQRDSHLSYHAVRAALQYARFANASILLGSATPDINLRYEADFYEWPVLKLPDRIIGHKETINAHLRQIGSLSQIQDAQELTEHGLPPVHIVDMREELKAGNPSIMSTRLHDAITAVLRSQQQAILFLNRRGSATYVFCRECGHVLECPNCDKPLIAHHDSDELRCHTCAYTRQIPTLCPQCGSDRIRQYGTGTEKVERFVHELFPQARILRYDHETTRSKGAHEIMLSHFANHRADILIGTQMLSKGLDLPLVTLVGVILADVGLTLPDFRANERVFQLLTQVAGRAGRSPLGGQVVLQTFNPEHYVIQHAAQHDYEGFYTKELGYRKTMAYPPFTRLVRLETRDMNRSVAEQRAKGLAEDLQCWIEEGKFTATRVIGPAPCFFHKINNYYRWQIILNGPAPAKVISDRKLDGWMVEIDPPTLL
ncbi:MAG: primosomal protein N' [Anaerolineae bacterium]|nr:primosomal protein N' [Anaerolineae bacterium]